MPQKEISNYHEVIYLAAEGCMIDEVTIHPHRLDLEWTMKVSGEEIDTLERQFAEGTAAVNMRRYILAEQHIQKRIKEAKLLWLANCRKRGKRI